jgi:phosphate/sulfate permease
MLSYADLCRFMLIYVPIDVQMSLYMLGMFCAILSAGAFLLLVTFTALPVSTTHAIVGAVVGMTAVGVGWDCLEWKVSEHQIKQLTLPRILVPGVVRSLKAAHSPPLD